MRGFVINAVLVLWRRALSRCRIRTVGFLYWYVGWDTQINRFCVGPFPVLSVMDRMDTHAPGTVASFDG